MLRDIEKETVDLADNFDGTMQEPKVLPAGPPNLLLNGAAGIAVGMATNIPPHNLNELCAAISLLIDDPDASVEQLMGVLPGPDFPTGGIILGQEGIRTAYSTGKGHFIVRAKAHIEEATRGRFNIIVTELPYQVNKARLLERIADLVKQERITDISDLRDESDRTGMRIVITLKREAEAHTVLNQLFKYTPMQVTFGVNLLALVDGTQPRVLPLKRMLQHYISHRQEVIIRRARHELQKARHRAHVLEGLKIALDNLDEVIDTIRRSRDADTARVNLMRRFRLSEIQAQAILDLQLRRLAALERKKVEEEYAEVLRRIAELEDILAHPKQVLALIQDDLQALRDKYGDPRRTRIASEEAVEITTEDLVPDVAILVTLTERGYVKRVPLDSYRRQQRGSRGVVGMRTREQDAVSHIVAGTTKDDTLFFSDRGKVYQLKSHQIPDAERDARGLPLVNLVSLDSQERVTGMVPVPDFEAAEYLVMVTRNGRIKRTSLSEFRAVRSTGVIATLLEEGDSLVAVRLAAGQEDVVVVTASGQALRFSQEELRPMGRNAGGVKAIALGAEDVVVGMDLCCWPEAHLLVLAGDGFGKRSALPEYPAQGRAGKGVATGKAGQRLACVRVVRPEDEVTIISAKGVAFRVPAGAIPQRGRATRGDRVLELDSGDSVVAVAVVRGETGPEPGRKGPAAGPSTPAGTGEGKRARKKTTGATAAAGRRKAPGKQAEAGRKAAAATGPARSGAAAGATLPSRGKAPAVVGEGEGKAAPAAGPARGKARPAARAPVARKGAGAEAVPVAKAASTRKGSGKRAATSASASRGGDRPAGAGKMAATGRAGAGQKKAAPGKRAASGQRRTAAEKAGVRETAASRARPRTGKATAARKKPVGKATPSTRRAGAKEPVQESRATAKAGDGSEASGEKSVPGKKPASTRGKGRKKQTGKPEQPPATRARRSQRRS